jgi:hypothetical protein
MIVLKVVIFRLAHGHSCENMEDLFNVGASTITKYMKIIVSVIVQILFSKYFHNLVGSGCVAL